MVGVPSTYTPEIGATILKHMEDGYSLVAAAAHVNVGVRTIYDWLEKYPEFKLLHDVAKAKRQLWWETDLKTTQSGARVTAGLKALGGMRSPDWSEDKRLEIDVNHNHNHTLQIADLTTEQLASLAAMLAPKASDDSLLIDGQVIEDDG